MKYVNFFLSGLLLACGCQNQEEDDLEPVALMEDEFDTSRLTGNPIASPQEFLIKEPASIDLQLDKWPDTKREK